jgi:arabinose-5-phosphate isomerase
MENSEIMVNRGLTVPFPFDLTQPIFRDMPMKLQSSTAPVHNERLSSARRTLETEASGMAELIASLTGELGVAIAEAVELISASKGRVIISGMGKSGHVGRKIASTLASTGTPALFVHPAEASHGDLGMITTQDVVVMLSNSGESAELIDILNYTRRFAVPLIAMTTRADSSLGRAADIVLLLPAAREACPNGLAPTTSTLLQLAVGDALAIALLEDKGFTAKNFREYHPGGKLGAQLKHVSDVMRKGGALPLSRPATKMSDALVVMTEKACGCLGIIDDQGKLIGILTDGDLRRHMSSDLLSMKVQDVMTKSPKTIEPDALTSEALEILNSKSITSIFVIDEGNKPIGLVHIHDLLRIGVT